STLLLAGTKADPRSATLEEVQDSTPGTLMRRRSSGFGCGEGVIVPPADDTTDESFCGLVLQLRGRTGLTQRELSARAGVNVSSIQGWETGTNHPGLASLKALIEAGLDSGGFPAGR